MPHICIELKTQEDPTECWDAREGRSARIVLVNSKHYSIRTRFLSHNL